MTGELSVEELEAVAGGRSRPGDLDRASEAVTRLLKELQKRQVLRIVIGGLATDYSVKNTVLDALKFGFESYLLADGSRGIDANPGDVKRSLKVMQQNGAKKVTTFNFLF